MKINDDVCLDVNYEACLTEEACDEFTDKMPVILGLQNEVFNIS